MKNQSINNQNYQYRPVPQYSKDTLERLNKKKSVAGKVKELNSLAACMAVYNSDDEVLKKIFYARLHKTDNKCPVCQTPVTSFYEKVPNKLAFQCRICRHTVFPLVDTPLQRTHIKLKTIVELLYGLVQSKHGLSAAEVAQRYGLKPDTSWRVLHRLRLLMVISMGESEFFPEEEIEMDEVHVTTDYPFGKKFTKLKRGTGSQRQAYVFTLVGRESGVAKAYYKLEKTSEVVKEVLKEAGITKSHKIKTDENTIYSFLENEGYDHSFCTHHNYKWVGEDRAHTNTLEGMHALMKGQYRTTHRGVTKRHLQKYVSETVFRFSMRHKTIIEAIESLFGSLPPLFSNLNF